MRQLNISVEGANLDYEQANKIARSVAGLFDEEPAVVAWHDAVRSKMSPLIEGADVHNRWHDYGESHGGDIAVTVNGDYDFIFADSSGFEEESPSPYVSVHDAQGNEYLCLTENLKDPNNPQENACYKLDDAGVY